MASPQSEHDKALADLRESMGEGWICWLSMLLPGTGGWQALATREHVHVTVMATADTPAAAVAALKEAWREATAGERASATWTLGADFAEKLAAAQASMRELCEALAVATAPQACDGSGHTTIYHFGESGDEEGCEDVPCAGCCACAQPLVQAALSRAPGSDAALNAVCEEVALTALDIFVTEGVTRSEAARAARARVLGEEPR